MFKQKGFISISAIEIIVVILFLIILGVLFFDKPKENLDLNSSSVQITAPNGGEELIAGENYEITWLCPSEAEADVVDIFIFDKNTGFQNPLNAPDSTLINCLDRSYSWQVDETLVGENSFKIELRHVAGSQPIIDESDNFFSIQAKAPVNACIDSDGGKDYYTKGSTYGTIFVQGATTQTWEDFCSTEDVLQEYSCEEGLNASVENYVCSNGCENGTCLKETE